MDAVLPNWPSSTHRGCMPHSMVPLFVHALTTECRPLHQVIAAAGGTLYIPSGVYLGRIVVPPVVPGQWITVQIMGDFPQAWALLEALASEQTVLLLLT